MIAVDIDNLWEKNKCFKNKMRSWLAQISKTKKLAAAMKRHFHQWQPLSVYVRAGSKGGLSLRFSGQEVARLVPNGKDAIDLIPAQTNKQYFDDLSLCAERHEWQGKKARKFRKYFSEIKINDKVKLHSPEHSVESRFIREMLRKSRRKFGGTLSGIQPVTFSGFPLQFPLPISGSSGKPEPSNGHIDILARRRAGGVCLSVWELKAPGKYKKTLRQVYIYSATLLKMLRDTELGKEWYKVLGFSGKIPDSLRIEGVIAITRNQEHKLQTELEEQRLHLNHQIGNDCIDLFAAYYNENTLKIEFEKIYPSPH